MRTCSRAAGSRLSRLGGKPFKSARNRLREWSEPFEQMNTRGSSPQNLGYERLPTQSLRVSAAYARKQIHVTSPFFMTKKPYKSR